MLNRLLTTLGIDAVQWRVLTRTYVAIDFRPTGGAVRQDGKGRSGMAPLGGLLFISAIGGAAKILTDDQRKRLNGFAPPASAAPATDPMAGGMKDM